MISRHPIFIPRLVSLTRMVILLQLFWTIGYAQSDNVDERIRIEILEGRVKYFYGIEKLDALLDISSYYTELNERKAIRYARQAVMLAEDIFMNKQEQSVIDSLDRLPRSYLHLGRAYYWNNKFIDAKETFEFANVISTNKNYTPGINEATTFLDKIDSLVQGGIELKRGFLSRSLKSLEVKEMVSKTTLDWSINSKINSAEYHERRYEYDEAISEYSDAINLLKNKGDQSRIKLIQDKIFALNELKNLNEEAIKRYDDAIAEQEKIVKKLGGSTEEKKSISSPGDATVSSPIYTKSTIDKLEQRSDSLNAIAAAYLERKDYGRADRYRLLSEQVENEIKKREEAETQLILLRQQKQLAELDLDNKNLELAGQKKAKQNFIIGLGLLVALALALLMLYVTKQRDHKRLSLAYAVLEETKLKLTHAEGNIRKLLGQHLSEDVAKELLEQETALPTKKNFVCIMFLDIRGFTSWAERRIPEQIIAFQNKVFGFMIDMVNEHNGNINQLLGDGFMATFGAPKSSGNDCQHAFDAATNIIDLLNRKIENSELEKTRIGIGLHAGYVVTGNVGTELRKQYSITGNTVILASRLEQLNKEFDSQLIISKEVYDKLEHYHGDTEFKKVVVKGRLKPIEILTVI